MSSSKTFEDILREATSDIENMTEAEAKSKLEAVAKTDPFMADMLLLAKLIDNPSVDVDTKRAAYHASCVLIVLYRSNPRALLDAQVRIKELAKEFAAIQARKEKGNV